MTQQLALGIDIGGTNTSFGIVDRRGQILAQGHMPTTGYDTAEKYIAALKDQLLPMIEKAGKDKVQAIGVGAPNANYYKGEIAYAANLPWEGIIPFAQMLSDAVGLKVTITNDANAAALGEMMYGAAKGLRDFVMVTLGTGVGSGFIANGQLIYGHDGFAGELGHVIIERNGRKCGCGRAGCLERYCSASGIVLTAEEWLKQRNDDSMLRNLDKITAKSIHEAAVQGDALALEIFEYTGMLLGEALANVVAITSPKAFVLFGGLANSRELLLEPVRRHMEANLLKVAQGNVDLLYSELPDADAAILGASALVW